MHDKDRVKVSSVSVSLHSMMRAIVKGDRDDHKEVEIKIKVLLTMHSKFNNDVNNAEDNDDAVPRWIAICNFLNLLNVLNQIKLHGKVKDAWEGAMLG